MDEFADGIQEIGRSWPSNWRNMMINMIAPGFRQKGTELERERERARERDRGIERGGER
jgi:hypothetical protein